MHRVRPRLLRRCVHGSLIGHVKQQRRECRPQLGLQAFRVGRLAHAAKHAEAALQQERGRSQAYAGGGACYHHRALAQQGFCVAGDLLLAVGCQ